MTANINIRANHIEETGVFFEKFGMTRMAGRIFGYLSVTDKKHVSFEELSQVLKASKSSISTNVKMLTQVGFIKPITLTGERKTYYHLTPDMDWGIFLGIRIQAMNEFRKLLEKAYGLRVNKNDNTSEWLSESIDFYAWLSERFNALMKEWRDKKEGGTKMSNV